jgi:hypothetical protein
MDRSHGGGKTSPVLVVIAWAFVGIPWLWGILRTLRNAAALFE